MIQVESLARAFWLVWPRFVDCKSRGHGDGEMSAAAFAQPPDLPMPLFGIVVRHLQEG